MSDTMKITRVRVWRHDGGRKTTEGHLALSADGSLTFSEPDAEIVWVVEAELVSAKHPWYSFGASLKISAPSDAEGLYMAYPPRNAGPIGNAIDTGTARKSLKLLRSQLVN